MTEEQHQPQLPNDFQRWHLEDMWRHKDSAERSQRATWAALRQTTILTAVSTLVVSLILVPEIDRIHWQLFLVTAWVSFAVGVIAVLASTILDYERTNVNLIIWDEEIRETRRLLGTFADPPQSFEEAAGMQKVRLDRMKRWERTIPAIDWLARLAAASTALGIIMLILLGLANI